MAKEAEELAAQAGRLRELKKMGRVTVPRIAKAVDVSERQVQRWLAGDSDIDGDNLKKLARYLGTTPDYIEYGTVRRGRSPTPDPLPAIGPTLTDRLEERLVAIQDLLEAMRLENAARDLAMHQRLDEGFGPSAASR